MEGQLPSRWQPGEALPPRPSSERRRVLAAPLAVLAAVCLLQGTAFTGGSAVRRPADAGRLDCSNIARRITLADIESLTVDDVPERWRTKVTTGQALNNLELVSIQEKLEKAYFLLVFNYGGMFPPEVETMRTLFPETVTVRALKNTLVRRAMRGTPWEPFSKALKGTNMYVFVEKDTDLKGTVAAYIKVEKQFRRADKLVELFESNKEKVKVLFKPLVGGCLRDEWKLIPPEDIPKLKDFPTKTELIARIAGGVKQVPTKLARSTKQITQKIAIGVKKISEKMEEEGKSTVGGLL